jgi:CRP-like cAMP-binding protein
VDELVARALPLLNHPQMLEATRIAGKKGYPPGTTIIRQGEPVQYFYMVQKGAVDILLSSPGCPELNLARLGPGQFFGEVELIGGGNSIASVCAAPGENLELALIPKDVFIQLLNDSPATQRSISALAQSRLEENLTHNGGCE